MLVTFELDQRQTKDVLENAVPGGEKSVVTSRDRAWVGGDVGLSPLIGKDGVK